MPRERADSGQYRSTVAPQEVLDVYDAVPGPVLTSADVADALNVTRETARRKLNALADDGTLDHRKTAGRVVYWRADTTDAERGREPAETAPSAETRATHAPAETGHDEPHTAATDDALAGAVDRVAAEWEGTDDRLAARKAAARAALDYAREHGSVSKQEAKEEVYPEHPVADQNARTWYRKNIRPVLNDAAEYDQSARAYRLTVDT
jgi:predicted ArsR family transcriptional regulator